MTKTNNFSKVQKMVLLAVLAALTLVMAFTPLGYLRIGVLSISFMCIPIAIGAITIGPSAGLFLGTLFGITSFAQCLGMDPFGTAMFTLNPFFTFVICVVSRALTGWLTGLISTALYKVFNNKRAGKYYLNDIIAIILCPAMNTLFFLGFMAIFFGGTEVAGLNVITMVVIPALSINCIVEIIACTIIGSAISIAVKKIIK
ncbi:MAG: ECF transporter S component [Ruminococcus sp.]|nr:ECF transporter S component [Ruminococcus sp.]